MPALDRKSRLSWGGQAVLNVGMPMVLHHFYHGKAWEAFLRAAGAEVTVSGPTDASVMERGVALCMRDICLPVKAFVGHIVPLARKCDRIFVPRLVSAEKSRYYCPKFLALPDMAAAFVPADRILTVEINARNGPHAADKAFMALARELGASGAGAAAAIAAMKEAESGLRIERTRAWEEYSRTPLRPRIAVLGHPYMARDQHLSSGVVRWLLNHGAAVVMYDDFPEEILAGVEPRLFREIYWESAWQIYRAALAVCRPGTADGAVVLSAFGCGPDSFVADLAAMRFREARMPMVRLVIDEHSAMVGIETRLEAFMDMIAMKAGRARP